MERIAKRLPVLLLWLVCCWGAQARTSTVRHKHRHGSAATVHRRALRGSAAGRQTELARVRYRRRHPTHLYAQRFIGSNFADIQTLTAGDVTAGEDPVARAAAIQALDGMNGTVVAINPMNGRILTMVNQKLALSAGAEPCSTIKLAVALAALKEGLVEADTPVNLGGNYSVDLTHALARSINLYFEVLGRTMGFERVKHYANEFGLGELAGYNIPGEHLGVYPDVALPAVDGGVGRMCSFGESISMTPLQLGALVSAIANGGTLYYLQHPASRQEVENFQPKVKRVLDIQKVIPQILPGMAGAVDFTHGTARSLRKSFVQFPVFGKTGTCSDDGMRFGWFVSYGQAPSGPVVTVIFLKGGGLLSGPKAAEMTGVFYRALYEHNVFPQTSTETVADARR